MQPLVLRFDAFDLDASAGELRRDGVPVPLRPRPFALLRVMAERAGRVLSKDELLDLAWPGVIVEENNLQVQVSVLRKLIGNTAITTVPGRGYRFEPAVESRTDGAASPAAAAPVPLLHGLIGREEDLALLADRVRKAKLVTLTGPGGIGKTRLAREAAASLQQAFSDGVHWVELAGVADPALLPHHVLTSMSSLRPPAADTPADPEGALGELVKDKQLLLVLDNAEQLAAAVAGMVHSLLQRAPGLRVLVTSQAPLRLAEEQVVRLEPLSLPPNGATLAESLGHGAVTLFARRAQAADRRFVLDEASLPRVLDICARLDGIPLALELAAARLPAFGLSGLATLLDERFQLLSTGHRTAPERHQTLAAVFDWTYRLLAPREQAVFRRLGVAAGRFTLEQAGQLARDTSADEGSADAAAWQVYDAVAALVDHCLLTMDDSDPPRYTMLETGRAYAMSKLLDAGEFEVIERASRWYEAAGDEASGAASGGEALATYSRALELAHALQAGPARDERELEVGLKLGPAIQATLGPTHPRCEQVYRRSVELARAAAPGERSFKALWGYWQFLTLSGRDREAATYAEEIVALASVLGDDGFELEALHASMTTSDMLGDAAAVVADARRIGAIYDRCRHHRLSFSFGGHDPGVCALGQGSVNLWLTGEPAKAREMAAQALALAGSLEHGYSRATGAFYAAITYAACGDTAELARTADALVSLSDQYGMAMLLTEGRIFRGRAHHELGLESGIAELREAIATVESSRDLGFIFIYMALMADALLATDAVAEARELVERGLGYAALGQGLFLPELYRLRGEARLRQGDAQGVEDMGEAVALARKQGALALELRAQLSAAQAGVAGAREALRKLLRRFDDSESDRTLAAAREFVSS